MDEERMRVLRMIAEGKITAEEGERLLEALTGPAPPTSGPEAGRAEQADPNNDAKKGARFRIPRIPPIPPIPPVPDLSGLKEQLRGMKEQFKAMKVDIEGAFPWGARSTDQSVESQSVNVSEEIHKLAIRSYAGGDVTLNDSDSANLDVQGQCEISTREGEITIHEGQGNDLTLNVPRGIRELNVDARHGGDIRLHAKVLHKGKTVLTAGGGGDICVVLREIVESDVRIDASGGGDVTLKLPQSAAFEIAMGSSGGGDVISDLPVESVERSPHSLRGRCNGGGNSHIELSASGGGDIRLLRLD